MDVNFAFPKLNMNMHLRKICMIFLKICILQSLTEGIASHKKSIILQTKNILNEN